MREKKAITILIVDDTPEDRVAYQAFLREQDFYVYTFLEAEEAEAGLALCSQAHIDCVLLDYQLPDLNGVEFLGRLKQADIAQKPMVVMITGRGSESVAVESFKLGAVDYLVKDDINSESLYRAVHNAVQLSLLNLQVAAEQHERRLAEVELRESELRFRLLVDSVADYAIVMLDERGRMTSWNRGARLMFNYHEQEILGQSFSRLFAANDVAVHTPQKELRLAALDRRVCENRWYMRKDGSRFWASSVLTPVPDPLGRTGGFSWVVRDISEKRQVVDGLRQAIETYTERVAQASPDLRHAGSAIMQEIHRLIARLEKPIDRAQPAAPDTPAPTKPPASSAAHLATGQSQSD